MRFNLLTEVRENTNYFNKLRRYNNETLVQIEEMAINTVQLVEFKLTDRNFHFESK